MLSRLPTARYVSQSFSALRHRNYRLLWTGTLISHSGDWMDQVAVNWLVLELTNSPLYLGLMHFCRGAPILIFTLLGGVMADRVERRRLMMLTQSAAMVLAFALAALVYFDVASIGLVLLIATGRGVMISFNLPARHTLISQTVPREDLANAIALHSVTANVTKVVGPLIGGVLIGTLGLAVCFFVNGATFLVVLFTLWAMTIPADTRARIKLSLRESLSEGFHYIRDHNTILMLVMIALVPTFFGQPYMNMLTVFAHDVFIIGPEGLGVLTASAASGAVVGAALLAAIPSSARRGATMLIFLMAFGALLVAFATNRWVLAAPVILFGVGAMQMAYNVSNNTILQMSVVDHVRGRVLSTLYLNRGLVSLGTALSASMTALVGARLTVAAMASVIVVLSATLLLRSSTMRNLEV